MTLENETYTTTVQLNSEEVALEILDTVGLELDSSLNAKTIMSVQSSIDELSRKYMSEDHLIKKIVQISMM